MHTHPILIIASACAALLILRPSAAQAQQPDAGQLAQRHSDLATKLFLEGDFAAAILEFYKAYELQPAPLLLYNIAICHQSMGELERAGEALGRALAHEDISAKEQAAASARLSALNVIKTAQPQAPEPEAEPDATQREPIEPVTASSRGAPGWYTGLMWSAAGVGVAGLSGALLINYSISDDIMAYEDARRTGRATQRAADAISADQRLGRGLLFGGAGMVVTGGLLWLLNPWGEQPGPISLELMLTPQAQSVSVRVPW